MKKILSIFLTLILSILIVNSKSAYYYYETINVPAGMSLFGLSVNTDASHVTQLFQTNNLPNGFTVYKLSEVSTNDFLGYWGFTYDKGRWSISADNPIGNIRFGEGIYLSTTQAFSFVVVGKIEPVATNKVKRGTQILSTMTIKSGLGCSVHNLSANHGDVITIRSNNTFNAYTYKDDVCVWDPREPSLNKFKGFFYKSQQDFDWIQSIDLPNVYNELRRTSINVYKWPVGIVQPSYKSLRVVGEIRPNEVMEFEYSNDLYSNSWFKFASFGKSSNPPAHYGTYWHVRDTYMSGYIRISTYQ